MNRDHLRRMMAAFAGDLPDGVEAPDPAAQARAAEEEKARQEAQDKAVREANERAKHGMLEGALHTPYPSVEESLKPGGMLREVAAATGRRVVFFCAFGERSAMAVQAARDAGLTRKNPVSLV